MEPGTRRTIEGRAIKDSADTASRLLRLLSLLQTRPHWPGVELADRLDVTTRTLRRDVVRLRDLGYPIEADPGVAGGYRLGSAGRLPPLLLDDDEAVAIAVGLRMATTTVVSGVEDAAVAALGKLDGVLPRRLRERVAAISSGTVPMPAVGLPTIDAEVLATLALGCRRGEALRFGYVDHAGRETERRVEPLRIVHTIRRWYLVGYDRDRDDWRTFRVDRVRGPELTGRRVTFTEHPDPVALVTRGVGVEAYGIEARILVEAEVDRTRAVLPSGAVVVEPGPRKGTSVIVVGANELGSLAHFALSIPYAFEVLDPPELRARVADTASRIAVTHATDPGR